MNTSPNDPRIEKLKKRQGPYRRVLDAIGSVFNRESGQTEYVEDLLSLVQQTRPDMNRFQVIKVLKALQEEGLGKFVTGRKGGKSRFIWRLPKSGSSRSTQHVVAASAFSRMSTSQVPLPVASTSPRADVSKISLTLRGDFPVEIVLPTDLTASEARRLTLLISALAANAEEGSTNTERLTSGRYLP